MEETIVYYSWMNFRYYKSYNLSISPFSGLYGRRLESPFSTGEIHSLHNAQSSNTSFTTELRVLSANDLLGQAVERFLLYLSLYVHLSWRNKEKKVLQCPSSSFSLPSLVIYNLTIHSWVKKQLRVKFNKSRSLIKLERDVKVNVLPLPVADPSTFPSTVYPSLSTNRSNLKAQSTEYDHHWLWQWDKNQRLTG